ncbi:arylesterase [Desulfoplanes formicivorans]|uniref:Arylesterase n=1 Tax=Desulfoplanes formicivorans TaxID=1592317 RepID=A0A194AI79_9BACT|nr:arylesterase [Desulfoplanes formicivorans]GAU09033.1 arylesterase [Desulfoplanes formicivorans]
MTPFLWGAWTRILLLVGCLFIVPAGLPAHAQSPDSTPTMHILAFGDSLTAGYRLGPQKSFASRLEAALLQEGYDVRVTNAGISGDTTSAGRSRLAWSLEDTPHLVILELGANDALRGIDPAIIRDNLAAMIKACLATGSRVLLCGITPPGNFGPQYARTFSAMYEELAEQFTIPLYPAFLKDILGNPRLTLDDGLHPNPQGVDKMVANILPQVTSLLDDIMSESVHSLEHDRPD